MERLSRTWLLRASEGPAGRRGQGRDLGEGGESPWPLGQGQARARLAGQRPVPSGLASDARGSTDRKELEQHGVRTAEKLLREFYPHSAWGQTQLRLLQSLCLLATREKANMEAALGTFIEMAQAEVHQLPTG